MSDPRVERSRTMIRRAALAELADTGYAAMTIESVAARAGAGKSTIYRHWSGKAALVADALETLNRQPEPVAAASPVERVVDLVRHFAEVAVDPLLSGCLVAQIDAAERDPTMRELHHGYSARRRRGLADALVGLLPAGADPDLAAAALAGAVLYRRVMTGEPLDPARARELVDVVLGRRPASDGADPPVGGRVAATAPRP